MNASELIKRMGCCKKIEASLQSEEEIIQKMIRKYHRELNKAEARINAERATRHANLKELEALERMNKKLVKIIQQEENKLRKNAHFQEEYEKQTKNQAAKKLRNCIKKECLLSFLNKKRLPGAAQGMNVCQGQFVPYRIPIDSFNMSDVPSEFWSQTQNQNVYSNHWDALVFEGISLE